MDFVFLVVKLVFIYACSHQVASEEADACSTELRLTTDSYIYDVGSNISIYCTVSTTPPNMDLVTFMYSSKNGSSYIRPSHVTDKKAELVIENARMVDSVTYSCLYGNCRDVGFLNSKTIVVGEAPSPTQPPDFYCVSQNNWNMTCHWNTVYQHNIVSKWQLWFATRLAPEWSCCTTEPGYGEGNCTYTYITRCWVGTPDYHQYVTYRLVERNSLGQVIHNYTVRTDDSVLLLNPVSRLKASASSRDIRLTWTLDSSPAAVRDGIVCNVTISSQREPLVYQLHQYSITQVSLDVRVSIDGLDPYTLYVVNVTCRPHPSRFWSDQRGVSERTRGEAPTRNPELYTHTFTQLLKYNGTHQTRQLYLYWKVRYFYLCSGAVSLIN